jgi:hypothetical protein
MPVTRIRIAEVETEVSVHLLCQTCTLVMPLLASTLHRCLPCYLLRSDYHTYGAEKHRAYCLAVQWLVPLALIQAKPYTVISFIRLLFTLARGTVRFETPTLPRFWSPSHTHLLPFVQRQPRHRAHVLVLIVTLTVPFLLLTLLL